MKHATLLIAHGSTDPQWRAPLDAVLSRLRELAPGETHALAFLAKTPPQPAQALAELYQQGVRSVTIIMALMSGGGSHFKVDVPEIVAAAARVHPDLTILVMPEPLGAMPNVTDALARACLEPACQRR